MSRKISTPCIGVCSTGIGDSVCRGCKRFAHEVISWNAYSDDERRAIAARLESLLTQVVEARLLISDPEKLEMQLRRHKVRLTADVNLYCKAYEAVRCFGTQLPSLAAIGCAARDLWVDLTIGELKRAIDEDLYRLSCAHYERYFPEYI